MEELNPNPHVLHSFLVRPENPNSIRVDDPGPSCNRWSSSQLPNQVFQTMPSIYHQNGDTFQPREQDGEVALRLWDMNPETSTVRWIIRNNILKHLSKQPRFREWGQEERYKMARLIDEKLFVKAESQVHYMNLSTLETRLNDLINDHEHVGDSKDLSCDVSSSSIGSTAWSSEVSHDMEPSSSDTSYRNISTSSGYQPNGHHFLVANASIAPSGNVMHYPETILQPVPEVSTYCSQDRFSGDAPAIPPNQYIGCRNRHVLHTVGGNGQFSMPQMPSSRIPNEFVNGGPAFATKAVHAAAPERCMDSHLHSDMHFMPDCNLSSSAKLIMPASSFGSGGNFKNVHLLDIQSNLAINSAYTHSPCLEQGQFVQCRRLKECQPSCQWPYQLYNQSDQLQLQQKEQYLQQQLILVENRISDLPQPQNIVNGSGRVKGCIVLNQVPLESQTMHDVTQQPWPSVERSTRNLSSASESVAVAHGSGIIRGEVQYVKQHKILLLYHHAMYCSSREIECKYPSCMAMKRLLNHISHCNDVHCAKRCFEFKSLFNHYRDCCAGSCGICGPVRMRLENISQGSFSSVITVCTASTPTNTVEHEQSPLKRMKTEHPSLSHSSQNETAKESESVMDHTHLVPEGYTQECQELSISVNITAESMNLGMGLSASSSQTSNAEFCEIKVEVPVMDMKMKLNVESVSSEVTIAQPEQENIQVRIESDKVELEDKCMVTASSAVHVTGTKLGKLKLKKKGISLIDSFTPDKIREHISSLTECVGQSKEKAEENQGTEHVRDTNTCSLCWMNNIRFEPPARYCASCSKQINPKGIYYFMRSIANGSDTQNYFCSKCFSTPGESVKVGGRSIPKANLEKGRNYTETDDLDEWWVQCDKCKAWQHQICALFNPIRNQAVQADYTCPTCFLQEIESGEHEPLLQSTVLRAKDLPTTMLSDHIEQWLFRRLKEERQERANSLGKNFYEVPTAEDLVVRVVSSVVKKLEVKQVFRDIFQEEKYPSDFSYKSKAILLFQKIDGADVCLFGMYVEEYGSKCACPNKRRVCISYIDSVKYFRPKITAATGEALRTFVYHEILIGYLDYCKKRGFTSCYIWACPPLKRDDYILYCHPRIQKMPKSDKLREWYQTMIRKAVKEEIVVENTNLYDHFFVLASECKAKVTAARLPYFDSDYWPGEAEVLLQREDGNKPQKKGRKSVIDRALRAARRDALIGNPKDILLMHQLGEIIRPMKEDFIIVHLQHACKHCCHPILSGKQWVCNVCKNFQLCEECFLLEQNLEKKDRHPISASEKHSFHKVEVENVLADTIDEDETVRSELFDTRLVFLSHCQNNHYQFDTLRRAKHSTMMFVYKLHYPTPPAFISSCIGCHNVIGATQGWHCVTCTGYDLCDPCYQKEGTVQHEHELVRNATVADNNSQPSNANQQAVPLQEQNFPIALVHASKCHARHCTYPFCRKIRGLFHHGAECRTRAKGGCKFCLKMWYILQEHARGCNESKCQVPRCKDLKEYGRKQQLQADSRRRAGAKERMKERIKRQQEVEIPQGSN